MNSEQSKQPNATAAESIQHSSILCYQTERQPEHSFDIIPPPYHSLCARINTERRAAEVLV